MGTLRVRIELNKGREGMPVGKLSRVCAATETLLTGVARDLGIDVPPGAWLAERFENGSVDFDLRLGAIVGDAPLLRAREALRWLVGGGDSVPVSAIAIRAETREQLRRISATLDPGEVLNLGIYEHDGPVPEVWYPVIGAADVDASMTEGFPSVYAEVQGNISAFFTGLSGKPTLRVRELSTGDLIRCEVTAQDYVKAVDLLGERDAVVYVAGWVRGEPGFARSMQVEQLRKAPAFDLAVFSRGLGAAPGYTGSVSSEDAVRQVRDGE